MATAAEKRESEKRDAIRWSVLKRAWDALEGDITKSVPIKYIVSLTSLEEKDIRAAVAYWNAKGATKWATLARLGFFITESGVDQAEALDRAEDEQASPQVTNHQYNFTGPVGALLTGSQSTASVVQQLGVQPADLLKMLAEIRSHIEAGETDDREVALATTAGIERELQKPSPDRTKLAKFGAALQAVVTGTATALLTAWLKHLTGV